jgi:uncharacterized protein (TIGR03083 family)
MIMEDGVGVGDALQELGFALAEGGAEQVTEDVRARVVRTALAARAPGRPSRVTEDISGLEAFRSVLSQMDALLAELGERDWQRPALRDLDVQELLGHLIAAEEAFLDGLRGLTEPTDDGGHVSSTQATAKAQSGRPPAATHSDWRDQTTRTVAACAERAPDVEANYYGIVLPLDQLLVVRSFEVWLHHEDIRRATGRALQAPDDAVLARMVQLAAVLLPIALARTTFPTQEATVRLVLTGTAGGTWDIQLGGPAMDEPGTWVPGTVVVVDAATFCRVVGNREGLAGSQAAVLGEIELAEQLFRGAASLALD